MVWHTVDNQWGAFVLHITIIALSWTALPCHRILLTSILLSTLNAQTILIHLSSTYHLPKNDQILPIEAQGTNIPNILLHCAFHFNLYLPVHFSTARPCSYSPQPSIHWMDSLDSLAPFPNSPEIFLQFGSCIPACSSRLRLPWMPTIISTLFLTVRLLLKLLSQLPHGPPYLV